jgi:tellurium resistance protein TerD
MSFIFYNNKQSYDGSIFHHGDNLTGAGEGDDEQVSVDLTRVPADIHRIVIVCSIYDGIIPYRIFVLICGK